MATITATKENMMSTETYRNTAAAYLAKLDTYDDELVQGILADVRKRNARTRSHETRIATQLMIDCCTIRLSA